MTDLDQETILAEYRGFLMKTAMVMLPYRRNDWHDLAQEGWLAIWKALQTFDPDKGSLPAWVTTAARLRMAEVVRKGHWTGTLGARGHVREKPATPVSLEWDWVEAAVGSTSGQLEQLLMAYHEGEILAAINELSAQQREYVYRRFWLDEQPETLNKEIGNRWAGAKPKLAESLRHLRKQVS